MKVYIAGKITGDPLYKEKFEEACKKISEGKDCIVLNPAALPAGMSNADYMRICFAMIDSCDFVVTLPDSNESAGAKVELAYADYIGKWIADLPRWLRISERSDNADT